MVKGCDNAIFIVRCAIEYFIKYGSKIFAATLDLTKAFASVSHCGLLIKLRAIFVPPDIIVMFIYCFQHTFAYLVWAGVLSDKFCIKSGYRR